MRAIKLLSLLLMILLISSVATTKISLADSTPTVYIDPPKVAQKLGETFTVNIKVRDIPDVAGQRLYAWEVSLGWDATILDYVSAAEGNFLKQGGYSTYFNPPIIYEDEVGTDYIQLAGTRTGLVPGAYGEGTIATVTLLVDLTEFTALDLFDTKLRNDLQPPQPMPHDVEDGLFGPAIKEDIFTDGAIDIFDLCTVAIAFGTEPGDENWNPDADMNDDSVIDIADLAMVGQKFGYYF